jgi:hypothetical protein
VRTRITARCVDASLMREVHLWGVRPSTFTQRIGHRNWVVGAGASRWWGEGGQREQVFSGAEKRQRMPSMRKG